jgi:hypothetical protein
MTGLCHRLFEPVDFADEHHLIGRVSELRRQGRIGPVLADGGVYYICESEQDPWGTRRRYSVEQLRRLVEELERAERRPVGAVGSQAVVEARVCA